jgi:hypothetical protein
MTAIGWLIVVGAIALTLWILGGRVPNFPGEVRTISLVVWITCLVIVLVLIFTGHSILRL